MALNQVAKAGDGTFDWRRVEIAFHTPPDAVRAHPDPRGRGVPNVEHALGHLHEDRLAVDDAARDVRRSGVARVQDGPPSGG